MSALGSDAAAVISVIDEYVEACRGGEADRLAQIFHPEARMFGQVGRKTFADPIAGFVEHVRTSASPASQGAAYEAWVRQAQVVGDTAIVTLEERGYQGRNYIDQFALIRPAQSWLIVAKIFVVVG